MDTAEAEHLITEWEGRFETLRASVNELHTTAQIIEALDEEIVARPREGSGLFVDVLRTLYAEAQCVRVRRLIDSDPRSESLDRLLASMLQHPEVLTRK